MRKKIVAGNWKMNQGLQQGLWLTSEIINMIKDEVSTPVLTVIIPPFIHLNSIRQLLSGSKNIYLGAQNCSEHKSGAYTGEISANMLKTVGVQFILVGHSERRAYQKETEEILSEKILRCIEEDLTPIYCVGETLEQREAGDYKSVIKQQLVGALSGLNADQMMQVVIAYEPVWAIGTGKTASPEQAQEVHAFARGVVNDLFGNEVAEFIPILYGGSVNNANADKLFEQADIDGGLVGGASLKSREFVNIIKAR